MMARICLLDLPPSDPVPVFEDGGVFHLNTCQRNLFIGKKIQSAADELISGEDAYRYLLEIICGLKSKLIAENEIVSQFKQAYKNYLEQDQRDSDIIRLLEKLFQDAKKIRSDYLMKIGQCSYAGLSKKIISQNSTNHRVLILGSGAMAIDLVKVLKKRFKISISARNSGNVEAICQEHNVDSICWGDHHSYFSFSNIVNTIGANKTLFKHQFFLHWSPEHRVFIDIGTPSGLDTTLGTKDGIYKLEDIFNKGIELNKHKSLQIEKSKQAINTLANKRHQYFMKENQFDSSL